MPMKGSGETALHPVDEWEGGAGWIAYPDESMQRASHALVHEDQVYVVDPVDTPDLDEFLAGLGDVAGVLVLLDRHQRDAAAVAQRHGVSVHRPAWMKKIDSKVDAPIETLGAELADTGFEVRKRLDTPIWKEAVLYRPDDGVLLVPESLGTVDYYRTSEERVGVHPMLRFTPPRALTELDVSRLLVGHGPGLSENVNEAISAAVSGSARRAPRLYVQAIRDAI